jgi:hypothetical protein
MPSPIGEVTVIVPVAVAQVGCITVAAGAAGVNGWASITILADAGEVHPAALVTV